MDNSYIEFGKIVNTHGLKGEMKIYSNTNRENIILKLKEVNISETAYEVQSIKMIKNMFLVKLKGIDTIEQAEKFLDKKIERKIDQKEITESEKNQEYFIKDLMGMDVFNETDVYIGKLKEVFETGANDVYQVVTDDGKEILLPAIKQVILDVDLKNKKIKVKIMEGLL